MFLGAIYHMTAVMAGRALDRFFSIKSNIIYPVISSFIQHYNVKYIKLYSVISIDWCVYYLSDGLPGLGNVFSIKSNVFPFLLKYILYPAISSYI